MQVNVPCVYMSIANFQDDNIYSKKVTVEEVELFDQPLYIHEHMNQLNLIQAQVYNVKLHATPLGL